MMKFSPDQWFPKASRIIKAPVSPVIRLKSSRRSPQEPRLDPKAFCLPRCAGSGCSLLLLPRFLPFLWEEEHNLHSHRSVSSSSPYFGQLPSLLWSFSRELEEKGRWEVWAARILPPICKITNVLLPLLICSPIYSQRDEENMTIRAFKWHGWPQYFMLARSGLLHGSQSFMLPSIKDCVTHAAVHSWPTSFACPCWLAGWLVGWVVARGKDNFNSGKAG